MKFLECIIITKNYNALKDLSEIMKELLIIKIDKIEDEWCLFE